MSPACPHCRSSQVITRNHARKVGGTIGAIAGAASGFSAAMKGANLGGRIGLLAGPPGAALGTVAGAILGGLLGGTAGCSAGTALGELVDAKVLANYRCLQCRHTFGESSAETYVRRPPSFGGSGAGAYGAHAFDPDEDDDTISLARG